MTNKIFSIELDLNADLSSNRVLDAITLDKCLMTLHNRFPEVVYLHSDNHLFIVASGVSLDLMIDLLFPFFNENRTPLLIPSEEETLHILMKIASGDWWKDISPEHIKILIHEAAMTARVNGSLGSNVQSMLEEAWHMNAFTIEKRRMRKKEHSFLSIPIQPFDFSMLSLN